MRYSDVSDWTDGIFPQANIHYSAYSFNYIHDMGDAGGDGHGVYLGSNCNVGTTCPLGGGNATTTDSYIQLKGNIVARSDSDPLHANGIMDHITMDSNIIYGAISAGIQIQNGMNNSLIQNNIMWTLRVTGIRLNTYSNGDYLWQCNDITANTFRNNTVYADGQNFSGGSTDGSNAAMDMVDGGNIGDCATARVARGQAAMPNLGNNIYDNNIFIHNCSGSCTGGHGPVVSYVGESGNAGLGWGATWAGTDTWRNNIIDGIDSGSGNQARIDTTAKTYAQFISALGTAANNLNSNPLFVAANPTWNTTPANWNLNILAGSPAIGAAYQSDIPTYDITGRIIGNPSNIGAYGAGVSLIQSLLQGIVKLSGAVLLK